MKIHVERTSDWHYGEIRDYDTLEDCINDLLEHENYGNNSPEVVVSKPNSETWVPEKARQCDFRVEIYDTWRE